MTPAKPYNGPMETPPRESLAGALGWTFISEPDPDDDRRWRVAGWRVVFPDHVLEVNRAGIGMRDTVVHAA
jgi:hypothetical protein